MKSLMEKRSDDEIQRLRASRKFKESQNLYQWGSSRDVEDIFDLKYLYDDEDIVEIKNQLIVYEEESLNRYHYHLDDEDDENEDIQYYANLYNQILDADDNVNQVQEEEENWDDHLHAVRFHYGLGFVTDEYDSGYDEPNARREPYLPDEDEEPEIDQEQMSKLLEVLRSRVLQRQAIVAH